MRTEVKIAAVIVILLVIVGGVWWFVYYKPANKAPDEGSPVAGTPSGDRPTPGVEPIEDRAAPDAGSPGSGTDLVSTDAGAPAPESTSVSPDSGTALGDAGSESVDPGAAGIRLGSVSPTAQKPWWESSTPTIAPSPGAGRTTPPRDASLSVVSPTSVAGSTYVVKDGDSYWSIAKSVYGDATLYAHLQKANPNIPAMSLRKGMTIKVPAKPAQGATSGSSSVASSGLPVADHGKTFVDTATGKRYYVVKKGDSGFWGISIAVFQQGKYFKQIQDLNPGINPTRLRAGQKIIVPDRPVETARTVGAGGGLATSSGTRAPAASSGVSTGAPTRTAMSDGRVFD